MDGTNYEVILRDMRTGNRRSHIVYAHGFGDAESIVSDPTLTERYFDPGNEEIIEIKKEYDAASVGN